jgi:transposase-like protein
VATEKFPRRLIRRVEGLDTFPLVALSALLELRAYLDEVEAEAILQAKELGASAEDIAEALGITRQGAYYKIKQLERGEPADNNRDGGEEDITVTLPEAETPRPSNT